MAGVTKSFGDTPVLRGVDLRVAPGTVLSLLGPSGCGKTTLLRIIAGLERPDGGCVRIDDRTLVSDGIFVPPERRRVGMVFQDWALFPHMTVAQNVAFGLPRAERESNRTDQALELVGLVDVADRLPGTLSGGQQQRVALARALAPRPSLLLLDEPFSNLDVFLRGQVRRDVHRLLRDLEITAVFVTHDQEEAFVMGDEVTVLWQGRVAQQAPPAALYSRPDSRWVAGFVGEANLVEGFASGCHATTAVGTVPLAEPREGPVDVLVRPEALRLEEGAGGLVERVEFYGHDCTYQVTVAGGQNLRIRALSAPRFGEGDRVQVRYVGPDTVAYPREAAPTG